MSEATGADGDTDVQVHDGPIDADEWTTVVLHRDGDHVQYSMSTSGPVAERFADPIVDAVPAPFFHDADRYDDLTPIGVALLDTDADEAMVVWLGDTIAFEANTEQVTEDQDGETVAGGVAVIGRSGTLRVRGIGAVDVEPTQVVEVVERGDA